MMIGWVAVFTAYFFTANKRQRAGRVVLEGMEGFRFTY
jgi:hypothetical protein